MIGPTDRPQTQHLRSWLNDGFHTLLPPSFVGRPNSWRDFTIMNEWYVKKVYHTTHSLTPWWIELYTLLLTPPDWMDVGWIIRHHPVVVVYLPAVKVDEDAAVEDVGDGGRAHQGRVGDVDGLKFAADAPVGARRELRIYVYLEVAHVTLNFPLSQYGKSWTVKISIAWEGNLWHLR